MAQSFRGSAPARINMLGNPADGNEGDLATISAAIELRAHVTVAPAAEFTVEIPGEPAVRLSGAPPYPLTGGGRLALGAVNRLWRDDPGFRRAFAEPAGARPRPALRFTTDVPRTSGLGGSSLFVLLTLASLREFYALDPRRLHDYRLAELAQQTEELELEITCGFADRYVPLLGGLAYVDYRGKLWHRGPDHEPYATYERLDSRVGEFPVVVAFTGVEGDSGDVHGRMRARYLEEARDPAAAAAAAGPEAGLVPLMAAVGETAWRGKAALLAGDWAEVGRLMNENHRLVDEMMRRCGFASGAGEAVNNLIAAARAAGALGAKLTGAGARGSIFVVTEPGREERMVGAFQEAAAREGLARAHVFRAELAREGLRIER